MKFLISSGKLPIIVGQWAGADVGKGVLVLSCWAWGLAADPVRGQVTGEMEISPERESVFSGPPRSGLPGLPFSSLLAGSRGGGGGLPSIVPGRLIFDGGGDGLSVGLGSGLTWNSNLFQDSEEPQSGYVSTSDLSLSYRRGMQRTPGTFFGMDYALAYFRYLDEELNRDREPFENDFSGIFGVKGSQTTVTLTAGFRQDNGNTVDNARQNRESLQSTSNNYSLSLGASRQLGRTSLSGSLGYSLQDYTGGPDDPVGISQGNLTDLEQWSGSVSWSIIPERWPKTSFSPTLGFGTSEQQDGVKQDYLSPSLGVTYSYDPKLNFAGSVGMDIRRSDGLDGESFTETAPTFALQASWQADETTSVSANISRSTAASALQGQSSSDTTSLGIGVSKLLGRNYALSLDYSYSQSSYTNQFGEDGDGDGSPGSGPGSPENYHRAGATLGRQFQLRPRMSLTASLFYQMSVSTGDDELGSFDQNTAGFRLGLDF